MADIFDQLEQDTAQQKPQPKPSRQPQAKGDVFDEVEREPVTQGSSAVLRQTLREGDLTQPDQQRLARTGVTPGTAVEFAGARIQQREEELGRQLSTGEQLAIQDAFKRMAGREDLSSQDFYEQFEERQEQQDFSTIGGRAEIAAKRVFGKGPEIAGSLIGLVHPETGEALQERGEEVFGTGEAPNVVREFGLDLGPEALKLAGYATTGPFGMAALYGTEGAGAQRIEVHELREQGEDISGLEEFGTAAGVGTVEAASGYVGGRIFKSMGNTLSRYTPARLKSIAGGEYGAVRGFVGDAAKSTGLALAEGTEEAVTEAIVNKIRQGVNPKVAITEGLGESFAMGAALSPFGAFGARSRGQSQQTDTAEAVTPDIETQRIGPERQLPAPRPAEEQLADVEREAGERAARAQRQPESGQRIIVDQQGRAMSQEQADALEQAGVDYTARQKQQAETQPKALPAPSKRFIAGPKGTQDLRDPEADRRGMAPEGRAEVNRLIEQGDQDAAQQKIAELQAQLRTDPVTGEGNKFRLNEIGQKLEARANRRKAGQPVVYLDVDNLHTANEVLGHEAMDTRMKDMARIMREEAGDKATITRQGGDEFAIMWESGQSQREARRILERVQKRIGRQKVAPGVSFGLTGGLGVVRPGGSFSEAYNQADAQATEAKRAAKVQRGEVTGREAAMEAARAAQEPTGRDTPRPESPRLAGAPETEQQRRADLKTAEAQRRQKRQAIFAEEAQRRAEAVAAEYKQNTGRGTTEPTRTDKVAPQTAQRIAMVYENMEHNPDDPEVQAAYEAFKQETLDQYNQLRRAGFTFELASTEEVAERYPDTAAISRDIGESQNLVINRDPGDMPDNHPLAETAPGTDGLTYNQVFRAVHDIFGHAAVGNELDILGEENAWRKHASMYSKQARGALATETRAQSNWVGYGPYGEHNKRKIKAGEIGQVQFPNQKAGLLPERYWTPRGVEDQSEGRFPPTDADTLFDAVMPGHDAPYIRDQTRIRQWLSRHATPVGTVIERWAPRLYGRLKQMQAQYRQDRHDADIQVQKLERSMKAAMPRRVWHQVLFHMQTAQIEEAKELVRENAEADAARGIVKQIDTVKQLEDSWHAEAQRKGVNIGKREGHFPRQVKNNKFREWKERLAGEHADELDQLIDRKARQMGRTLTTAEMADVANQWIGGHSRTKPADATIRGQRSVEDLTFEEWSEFYETNFTPFYGYFDRLIYATHKADMFGKKSNEESLQESLGRIIVEGKYGIRKLSNYQKNRLKSALESIFTGGEISPGRTARMIRDIGYMGVLLDPSSAAIQFGDFALTTVRDTLFSAVRALPRAAREKILTAENMGLDHLSQEYGTKGALSKALRKGFTVVGFKTVDVSNLNISLVSAVTDAQQLLKNPGRNRARRWREKWEPVFGEDFDQLVTDLQNDRSSALVKQYAYMAVSITRPVDSLEMPESYNKHPNARVMWQLKSFALKQFDLIRKEGYQKMYNGVRRRDPKLAAEGMAGWVRAMMILSLAGATVDWLRDWMLGRNPDFTDSMLNGLLYTHLGSMYLLGIAADEGPGSAITDFLSPPTIRMMDDLWKDINNGTYRSVKYLPFGKTVYNYTPDARAYYREQAKDNAAEKAAQAWADGDSAAARTYVNAFNDAAKQEGVEERLSIMSVRRKARKIQEGED